MSATILNKLRQATSQQTDYSLPGSSTSSTSPSTPIKPAAAAVQNGWNPRAARGRPRRALPRAVVKMPPPVEAWVKTRLLESPGNYCLVGSTHQRRITLSRGQRAIVETEYHQRTLIEDYREFCQIHGFPVAVPKTFGGLVANYCQTLGWNVWPGHSLQLRRSALIGLAIRGEPLFNGNDYDREHHHPRWLRRPKDGETLEDVRREHCQKVCERQKRKRALARAARENANAMQTNA